MTRLPAAICDWARWHNYEVIKFLPVVCRDETIHQYNNWYIEYLATNTKQYNITDEDYVILLHICRYS